MLDAGHPDRAPAAAPRPSLLPVLEETRGGNYFVSNYPPYSFWSPSYLNEALATLDREPAPGTPLGVYLHIPFCRKRCHFCYFKVYTDKNASEVEHYLEAAVRELALHAQKKFVGRRKPKFVYFGGGTPSYISSSQLSRLAEGMQRYFSWDEAEEVAFECEPGTLTEGKLKVIKELGVTRLSLGIENFDDAILKANGRAHLSKEIGRSYDFARSIGFPQINIDLIAGMVGETDENWRECVRKTIAMQPDSVTIYQMEVPFNTTIFKEMKSHGAEVAPIATWTVKRDWQRYAFAELENAGYSMISAYTAVRKGTPPRFMYTELLWRGADMIGAGVASFSHVQGTHFQNLSEFEPYCERLLRGELPLGRAYRMSPEERLLREFILQMKKGRVTRSYFSDKFGVDIYSRFANELGMLAREGLLKMEDEGPRLTRDGLLQVDRLLPRFYLPRHQNS